MNRRLLVSLIFLLAIDLVSTYVIEDTFSGTGEVLDEISNLEDVQERNLPKEPLVHIPRLKEKHKDSFLEVSQEDAFETIKTRAMKLAANECSNITVKERNLEAERESSLRPNYQAFQHGSKNFMTDEQYNAAAKSEKCSACVLNTLCNDTSIRQLLNINTSLPESAQVRRCKRIILRRAMRIMPKEEESIECDEDAKYRTINGTCNNLKNPEFGSINTKFERLIPADYGDCISTLRESVTGHPLPNTREVSFKVHGSNADGLNPNSRVLSHLAMNFGQFMDHDLSLAEAQGVNCEPPEDKEEPECINIHIPKSDRIFRDRYIKFIEMEREAFIKPDSFCKLEVREHPNTITAYIDASNVYGSTDEIAESLRAADGLLLVMKHPHGCQFKNLLPAQVDGFCPTRNFFEPCFFSGDIRNNENPGLNSVHTIFVREHNRIATFFIKNTDWEPEKVYQETRRIVGAELQIITYGEFLPLLLSEHTRKEFGLVLLEGEEFFTGYDKEENAQTLTAFAVAAYRFGHSLVQELFNRFSQDGFEHKCSKCSKDKLQFQPIPVLDFNNPAPLYAVCKGGVDAILRGLLKDPAAKADGRFSTSVQENLSRGEGDTSDLIAINIRRGHDRGLPSYTRFRRFCGLPLVRNFSDLVTVANFDKKVVAALEKVYKTVEDVDMFTGGMLEPSDPKGGELSATFQCILANQFKRTKLGDRFWHENAPNVTLNTDKTAFNSCQLKEIRKTRFSRIICDNSDDITSIQKDALMQSSVRVSCDELPKINLKAWITDCPSSDSVYSDEPEDTHDEF